MYLGTMGVDVVGGDPREVFYEGSEGMRFGL